MMWGQSLSPGKAGEACCFTPVKCQESREVPRPSLPTNSNSRVKPHEWEKEAVLSGRNI